MRYIDFSHILDESTSVNPGAPPATINKIFDLQVDGHTDYQVDTGMHVGTHVDAPQHMLDGGQWISDLPVDGFFGRGRLIDARDAPSIGAHLRQASDAAKDDIVLMFTGFSRKYKQAEYYESFPVIEEGFARLAIEREVKMVGMDTPSPDYKPYPIHKLLLPHVILVIENLTNLESLLGVSDFDIVAVPPRIHAEASPTRVVAVVK
ncbi:MAG: cyclase family protein [Candidatus Kerfeldbacteria bacterium]|nr:cyclase family protein [Candidatus Kerfeldbacteria bacterium]